MKGNILTHKLFNISLFLKGIFAFIEAISGVFLFFTTSDLFLKFIYYFFGHELIQDPKDFLVNLLLGLFTNLSRNTQIFFAIYLLIHGVIKLGLILSLKKEKLWAYPLAGIIFFLFVIYQIYKYFQNPSTFLILLTIIDTFVIILIYLEYKNKLKRN